VRRQFPELEGRKLATLYLGGGTPSLFTPEQLAPLFDDLRQAFHFAPDIEITMEANPSSLLVEQLVEYQQMGINRISLGTQSFDADGLRVLGRRHNADDARAALAALKDSGLTSWSADLIFGYPGDSLERLERDTHELVASYSAPHISAYWLTLHDDTKLKEQVQRGTYNLPEDELAVEQFYLLHDALIEQGLPAYEISNFARSGHESRHNTAYWLQQPMIPLGPSASGYLEGQRMSNPRSLDAWGAAIKTEQLPWQWEPPLTGRQAAGELLMCALRRTEGVTWAWFETQLGEDVRDMYRVEFDAAEAKKWISCDTNCVKLTRQGMLMSDEFFTTLF
jgi:oxygen-independent coproporphyrinogen-3 oxidase